MHARELYLRQALPQVFWERGGGFQRWAASWAVEKKDVKNSQEDRISNTKYYVASNISRPRPMSSRSTATILRGGCCLYDSANLVLGPRELADWFGSHTNLATELILQICPGWKGSRVMALARETTR